MEGRKTFDEIIDIIDKKSRALNSLVATSVLLGIGFEIYSGGYVSQFLLDNSSF